MVTERLSFWVLVGLAVVLGLPVPAVAYADANPFDAN